MPTTLTLRTLQSTPLTNQEVDNNFSSLKNNKLELDGSLPMSGRLELAASTSTFASINFASGVNTATANLDAGDLYYNSNQLKLYNGTEVVSFPTVSSTGVLSPNLTQINSASSLTLDVTTDIVLDSDSGNVLLKDGGTTFGSLVNSSNNFLIDATSNLIFDADGGSIILKDDGTEFGRVVNTSNTLELQSGKIIFNSAGDVDIDADSGDIVLKDNGVTFGVLNNNSGSAGNLVLKSGTNNALAFSTDGSTPRALLYGGVQGSYFTTSAAVTSGPAFLATVSAGSTSIFGSLGTEPSGSNMDFKGGWVHNVGFDSATGNFIGISDGANNGGAMMLASTGGNGIEFYTIASTGSSNQTISGNTMYSSHRKMVIDQNGRLTVYGAAHISGTGLAVGTSLTPSGTDGRIDASNDVVAFSTSDERLKENIVNIEHALEKVLSLRGVTFTWKEEHKDVHGYTGTDTGVIAQEVEKVLPEVVQHRVNGYMAVKYEKMMGLLIEAVKELNTKVDNSTCKCKCNCNK